ncbi:hypothetical protein FB45DRAFT_1031632 [Roridomyces roridus]|uniref:Uncharacterized protein n=1 Tax=Roridomyces roridus TaxID=1738132 RepID=A0AAD7BKI4_9AGAR|nr:hypothetical protein FB45DRAFT_1031632 [Roridomyces roridus]
MSITRRLSARRGSTTAADPYAKNAHLNCESSSILTIVRVASPPATPAPAAEAPRRAHRRIGSNPNSPLASPSNPEPPSGRLSFAFSSFAAPHQQQSSHPPRPASPNRSPSTSTFANKPRLTPDQLLEVAKQATNPRYVAPSHSFTSGPSHSPVISARSSSPQQPPLPTVVPATFTPLPPDVYLPFLDRPAEVKALLSFPPSSKLFSLLAQTFPKNVPPRESDALPINTADWTFADLSHWLNETTREEASDAFWVQTARRCILLHSELIWERLKGALGVPPELDVEYTEAEYNDVFEDDDEEESDGSTKHLDEWEPALDSPLKSSPNVSRHTSIVHSSSSTPGIITELPTPSSDYFTYSPIESSNIIIEPVLASVESAHPPPLSLPASLSAETAGLGDIGEEDEENEDSTPKEEPPPAQLHGLRICTPASPMPSLPSPVIRSATTGAPMRSPSFSARAHSPTFARSSSRNSLNRSGSFGSVHSLGSERDVPYDPVADRAPGNPIFPSNFARLALGPTLAANNPALRSPPLPPQSRYTGVRRSSSTRSDRGNRFRRSWAGGDEYAITVASSSAGGSVRDEA